MNICFMIHDIHLYSKNPTNVMYEERMSAIRLDPSPLKYQFYEQISSVIHVIKTSMKKKKSPKFKKTKQKLLFAFIHTCHAVPSMCKYCIV